MSLAWALRTNYLPTLDRNVWLKTSLWETEENPYAVKIELIATLTKKGDLGQQLERKGDVV